MTNILQGPIKVCDGLLSIFEKGSNYKDAASLARNLATSIKQGSIDVTTFAMGDRSDKIFYHIDKILSVFDSKDTITGDDIKAIYMSVIELSKSITKIIVDISRGNYSNLIDDTRDVAADLIAVIDALVTGAKKLYTVIKNTIEPMILDIKLKLEDFVDKVDDKFDVLKEKFEQKIDKIQEKFEKFTDKFKNSDETRSSHKIKEEIKSDIKKLGNKASEKIASFSEDAKESLTKIDHFFDKAGNIIKDKFDIFVKESKESLDKVGDFFDDVTEKSANIISSLKPNKTSAESDFLTEDNIILVALPNSNVIPSE